MKKWLLLFLFIPLLSSAQWQLSGTAEIHVVTCGPYQGELYSAFGHSAIRVKDTERGLDLIYNYGVFDFNQPNFYLNFARGHLNYRLAVSDYRGFVDYYISENRFVHEQVLNINAKEKQRLFDFLQWNARPENMNYRYDYFYDNCATRVRDAIEDNLGAEVVFDENYAEPGSTIREMCDLYLQEQPWGDLGIDLCLGVPMDKEATAYEYMFLPDYVELAFADGKITGEGASRPLVKETIVSYKPTPQEADGILFSPLLVFTLLLLFGAWLTYRGFKKNKTHLWFDLLLQNLVGLIGWFLLALWFFTDHQAAAGNMNILWAFPLYFPLVWLLLSKRPPSWLGRFYRIMAIVHALTLLGWAFLPQDLNVSLLPLVMLLLLRSLFISQRLMVVEMFGFKGRRTQSEKAN